MLQSGSRVRLEKDETLAIYDQSVRMFIDAMSPVVLI